MTSLFRIHRSRVSTSRGRRSIRSRGFTLVEVLMGTAVFSVGFAGSVGLVGWVYRAGAFNSRMVQATATGQAMLEELRDDGFGSARSGTSTDGMFDMSWTVSSGTNLMKSATCTVAWTNLDGHNKSVIVSTILTDETVANLLPGFVLPGNGGMVGGGGGGAVEEGGGA